MLWRRISTKGVKKPHLLAPHNMVPNGCSAKIDMKVRVAAAYTHQHIPNNKMNGQNYLRSTSSERRKSVMGNGSCPLTENDSWTWTLAAFEGKITNLLHYWLMFFSLILCIIYLGITVLHYVQSTPDNSNLQGKLKKWLRAIGSSSYRDFVAKNRGIRKYGFQTITLICGGDKRDS